MIDFQPLGLPTVSRGTPDISRKRLRVLHVVSGLGLGGAETLLYRLVSQPSDIEHHVICLRGREWYSPLIEQTGTPLEHLGTAPNSSLLSATWHLGRLIREVRPDVIQAWMYAANVSAGFWAKLHGVPIVWGVHHSTLETLTFRSRLLVYFSGLLARWIPNMVVNCSSRSASIHSRIGYGAAPGKVIHNGYDPQKFYPDQASRVATRKSIGIPDDLFLIACMGRWHPQKDIPNLLRAVRLLRNRGIPLFCILLGHNLYPENDELREAIDAAGVRDLVQPLGRRSDVVELARATDLHVLASADGEAFPNVVAETMLSGTPNVSTDVGDAPLIVGETGWIVEPRDSEALAAAIEEAHHEWKENFERWQHRRTEARQRISENFTFERMVKGYEETWRNALNGRKPIAPSSKSAVR